MRGHTIFAVAASLVAAVTAQGLSAEELNSLPIPIIEAVPVGAARENITYDAGEAFDEAYGGFSDDVSARRVKRDADCAPQPAGSGPGSSPDTDTAFLSNSDYSSFANSAETPAGWSLVFKNKQAAISTSAYMGYKTYTSYSVAQCASDCLQMSACQSFNIFLERDPTVNPAAACADPTSTVVIKCSFWGVQLQSSALTNEGQYRNKFHVVIAGSNGYQVTSPSYDVDGFSGISTGRATINSPNQCDSYITFKSHTGPYDPNLCAADCLSERNNPAQYSGKVCRYFASYQLIKNGQVQAQICALYTRKWDASYAVNTGYHSGRDTYTIFQAYSYSLDSDPGNTECNNGVVTSTTTTTLRDSSTVRPGCSCNWKHLLTYKCRPPPPPPPPLLQLQPPQPQAQYVSNTKMINIH